MFNYWKNKVLGFGLLSIILLGSPAASLCQSETIGDLSIFSLEAFGDKSVTVNGVSAINDQTIISPSVIETPLSDLEVRVNLGKTGRVNFGNDTKMNLVFDESRISGVLLRGTITVSIPPHTNLKIQTKDGIVETVDEGQENKIVIDFVNGKTRVKTLSGFAALNNTLIASRQYFIAGEPSVKNFDLTNKITLLTYFVVPAILIILSISGNRSDLNIDNNQVNVGPMK